MHSDYNKIREDNIRDYGQKTTHLKLLGEKLYTEKTHFIFELLQNAEDEEATSIQFNLYHDRLEVLHDGKPFVEENVIGICGIGEGTKDDDFTKIGKIGIGFKSVFAFTDSPEIYSGEEHFRIENYVRPYEQPVREIQKPWTTLFIFSFNAGDRMPEKSANEKIQDGLKKLRLKTGLFLRHITKIGYKLPDGTQVVYEQKTTKKDYGRLVALKKTYNESQQKENWLVFERSVSLNDCENSGDTPHVEVAYFLESTEKDGKKIECIKRTNGDTSLVVFFPTEKETNFGFIIQGPYITNSARNNIPVDDEWNKKLIKETSVLVCESLGQIKVMGLLTVSVLEALPIEESHFNSDNIFLPIIQAVLEELKTKELLPASDGTFISAKHAKLARGEGLTELFMPKQLQEIFGSPYKWLSKGITVDKTTDLVKYLNNLGVSQTTPDIICNRITSDFLKTQSEDWLIRFYTALRNWNALWRKGDGILRKKPFVKTQRNEFVAPFEQDGTTQNVFFPSHIDDESRSIKVSLLENKEVCAFFRDDLGIKQPDLAYEITKNILPQYLHGEIEEEVHIAHIHRFVTYWKQHPDNIKVFYGQPILMDATGGFKKPHDLYLDSPFEDTGLNELKDLHKKHALRNEYKIELADIEVDFLAFVKMIGIMHKLQIEQISPEWPEYKLLYKNRWEYSKWNDYSIRNLYSFFQCKEIQSRKSSYLLWKALISAPREVLCFTYLKDGRYKNPQSGGDSLIVKILKSRSWIISSRGVFCKPEEMTQDDLLPEFVYDNSNGFLTAIDFGKKATQASDEYQQMANSAKEIGFQSLEDARKMAELSKLLIQSGKTPDDLIRQYEPKPFGDNESSKPEIRAKRVKEIAAEERQRTKTIRERTVSITGDEKERARAYLLYNYRDSDPDKIMRCQICSETSSVSTESPFQTSNSEWHFEAYPLFDSLRGKLHTQNYLALCHNHAAMFRFIDDKELSRIEQIILNRQEGDERYIPVNIFGKEKKIWFTTDHINDLKSLLEQERAEGGSQ